MLGTNTKATRDIEIGVTAVDKSTARLLVRSRHDEFVGRIEDQCSAATQHIRSEVAYVHGDMRDQRASYFMKIRLKRRRAAKCDEVLRIPCVSIVRFSTEPAAELIRVAHQQSPRLGGLVRRNLVFLILCHKSCTLNANLRALLHLLRKSSCCRRDYSEDESYESYRLLRND